MSDELYASPDAIAHGIANAILTHRLPAPSDIMILRSDHILVIGLVTHEDAERWAERYGIEESRSVHPTVGLWFSGEAAGWQLSIRCTEPYARPAIGTHAEPAAFDVVKCERCGFALELRYQEGAGAAWVDRAGSMFCVAGAQWRHVPLTAARFEWAALTVTHVAGCNVIHGPEVACSPVPVDPPWCSGGHPLTAACCPGDQDKILTDQGFVVPE